MIQNRWSKWTYCAFSQCVSLNSLPSRSWIQLPFRKSSYYSRNSWYFHHCPRPTLRAIHYFDRCSILSTEIRVKTVYLFTQTWREGEAGASDWCKQTTSPVLQTRPANTTNTLPLTLSLTLIHSFAIISNVTTEHEELLMLLIILSGFKLVIRLYFFPYRQH